MNDISKKIMRSNPYTVHKGVAAQDIEENSVILYVICPELMPNASFGTVAAGITKSTVSLQDRDGNPISSQVTTANHLVATWEGRSNQRYPGMVRRGEPVEVYKNDNQDKFYWRDTGHGRDFRTTDRLHFEVGATDPSKPGVTKDDTNTYSAFLDSHNQKVGIKTSKANGEAAAFSMEANLAEGTFHISDDSGDPGNRIFLDTGTKSGVPVFHVNLTSGATFKLEKDNAFMKVPGNFQLSVGKRFVIDSPLTVFNLTKKGAVIINALNVAVNAGRDVVITAGGVLGISAVSTKISGVLISASMRAVSIVKGLFGSDYKPVEAPNPQGTTPVTTPTNTADTNVVGPPYITG